MENIDPRLMEIATALAEITPSDGRIAQLEEGLDLANRQLQRLQLEDQGWLLLNGGGQQTEGPDLEMVKRMSEQLRAAVAESPLPKQANNLRASYTFSEKFIIPNLEGSTETHDNTDGGKRRGRPTDADRSLARLREFASSRTARDYVLGKNAQELISVACSADGVYLLLGDDTTKVVHAISVREIDNTLVNPDFPDEVWAYQRTWNPNPTDRSSEPEKRWYYTDRFTGTRAKSIGEGQERVKVDTGKTILDMTVNTQPGWAFGVPDLWAGHVWNRNYLAAMKDGLEVTSLMAWLSAKVKVQSKAGSNATGVKVGQGGRAGSVQTMGEGNSIDTYATTGKGYDFGGLRDVAAIYALSAGVSVVDLLSSPAAAGSSYGSALALAPGMRRAIAVRRDRIAAWLERVLEWATGGYHQVTPASIEEETPHRRIQMLNMAHLSGLFHADEIRPEIAYLAGITLKHDSAPEGYMLPNNEESWARNDVDPKDNPSKPTNGTGQGQSTGDGGEGNSNDIRSDNIS